MKKLLFVTFVTITKLSFGQQVWIQDTSLNNQLIEHKAYVLSYNEECEQANWVKHIIYKRDTSEVKVKRRDDFREDPKVATGSAELSDYKGSGYDRGHMAPAADFAYDKTEMSESFFMSNMSPQAPSFNRGIWRYIESSVRDMVMTYDTVRVVTGAVLNDNLKRIGSNKVCVPEWYYKVAFTSDTTICYLIRNQKSNGDPEDFIVPLKKVEDLSGHKIVFK